MHKKRGFSLESRSQVRGTFECFLCIMTHGPDLLQDVLILSKRLLQREDGIAIGNCRVESRNYNHTASLHTRIFCWTQILNLKTSQPMTSKGGWPATSLVSCVHTNKKSYIQCLMLDEGNFIIAECESIADDTSW